MFILSLNFITYTRHWTFSSTQFVSHKRKMTFDSCIIVRIIQPRAEDYIIQFLFIVAGKIKGIKENPANPEYSEPAGSRLTKYLTRYYPITITCFYASCGL